MSGASEEPNPKALEALFIGALDREEPARSRWLENACGGNERLLSEVHALLDAHETSGDFLEKGPLSGAGAQLLLEHEAPVDAAEGEVVGPYTLVELLGEGGFGVVYRATQEVPVRREVAIKIIKLGMDTRQVIARFEAERQALAVMDHPSVARILDAGTTEGGRPYFVMDLVEGVDLTDFCDRNELSVLERCRLFIQLCSAVQHAHQRGLIHRDLKPSNVLVGGTRDAPRLKVIDFGIAKATTHESDEGLTSLRTRQGQVIGTPVYMSPEQATGRDDIDTRSDIYALGVILYELLVGSTPLSADELQRKAISGELASYLADYAPPFPSARLASSDEASEICRRRGGTPTEVRSRVRGDLDHICAHAMESERERRYESAAGLMRDVERFLDSRPIHASPPSPFYRATKFVRRHRIAVSAAAVVLGALLTSGVIALRSIQRANESIEFKGNLLIRVWEAAEAGGFGDVTAEDAIAELEAEVREAFGDRAPMAVSALTFLGTSFGNAGNAPEALVARERALDLARVIHGPESREAAVASAALGLQLARMGQLDRAKEQLRSAVELDDRMAPDRALSVNAARLELARLAFGADELAEARELTVAAERIAVELAPQDKSMRRAALEQLIDVHTQLDLREDARQAWQRLFDVLAELHGPRHREVYAERIESARWLSNAGLSAMAAQDAMVALDGVRGAEVASLDLEYDALVVFNRVSPDVPGVPAQRALDELKRERALVDRLLAPGTAPHLEALLRVAGHYELRGMDIDELAALVDAYRAVEGSQADGDREVQLESLGGLITENLKQAMEARLKPQEMSPEEKARTGEVLGEALAIGRERAADESDLALAAVFYELRFGKPLRIWKLSEQVLDADLSPWILGAKAEALARTTDPSDTKKREDAAALLETARQNAQMSGPYRDQQRRFIDWVQSVMDEKGDGKVDPETPEGSGDDSD